MTSQSSDASGRRKGRLFVISAPSGAGKGTVIRKLLELCPEIILSVSATTRTPRDGEVNGSSYYFVSRDRFAAMISNGELMEYAKYADEFYGTPKQQIYECIESGKDVILEIEVQGAKQIMAAVPEAVTIFIAPPSMEELERRLRGRGTDTEEKLAARLEIAKRELGEKASYDHIVINDVISKTAEEIMSILRNCT